MVKAKGTRARRFEQLVLLGAVRALSLDQALNGFVTFCVRLISKWPTPAKTLDAAVLVQLVSGV